MVRDETESVFLMKKTVSDVHVCTYPYPDLLNCKAKFLSVLGHSCMT